ncbi:hypothetical protein KPL40_09090 [Clostridium gasigenes]|uniref:hypothetical protein n=1 Tax=Clostridium gasigenes TaxID=94869 RepID=UPI001C0B4794|nr:hypothetical protein [Clostridium gasigenes]MBU3132611.1 hypothetical protein [Clostridium gasigenes]
MIRLWMNITFIGTVIGLIISVKTIIEVIKIQKQLRKIKEDELLPEDIRAKISRNMILMIVGISLTSISGLIRIFLR